jgi:monoamine oxidase
MTGIGSAPHRRRWQPRSAAGALHRGDATKQARDYENGIAVGWHRVPWVLGCFGRWTEEARKQHYKNLCDIDGRIALAGEHASNLPAWQEGAVLSSLDAISRLHQRVVAG